MLGKSPSLFPHFVILGDYGPAVSAIEVELIPPWSPQSKTRPTGRKRAKGGSEGEIVIDKTWSLRLPPRLEVLFWLKGCPTCGRLSNSVPL